MSAFKYQWNQTIDVGTAGLLSKQWTSIRHILSLLVTANACVHVTAYVAVRRSLSTTYTAVVLGLLLRQYVSYQYGVWADDSDVCTYGLHQPRLWTGLFVRATTLGVFHQRFASSPKYSLEICILLKSYFLWEFQAETLYACPKPYFVAVLLLLIDQIIWYLYHSQILLGFYSLRRRRLIIIGISIINLRRSTVSGL